MQFFLAQQKILNSEGLAITKAINLARLRFNRYVISSEYSKNPRCPFSEIVKYLESPSMDAKNWFSERLRSYLQEVVNFPGVKEVQVSTHRHRRHLASDSFGPKYTVDLASYVADVVNNIRAPSAVKIRFIDLNIAAPDEFIPDDPGSHLKPEKYENFILDLFKRIQ